MANFVLPNFIIKKIENSSEEGPTPEEEFLELIPSKDENTSQRKSKKGFGSK